MAKRWKKEEITYLKRYAKQRTLEELAARFEVEADKVEEKLSELGLKTSDGMGKIDLSDDPLVQLYERGVEAAHEGKWGEAKKALRRVVDESDLAEVVQRAEQYLSVCERYAGDGDGSVDDAYVEAVLQLNRGELDAVEETCARGGRREKDDRFAYLAAVVAALREDHDTAKQYLETAIRLNPRNRIQAKYDLDLADARSEGAFDELLG